MRRVTIMRGVPGSGKSTWVKNNRPDALVYSADDYHINKDGKYEFKAENLKYAHNWNLRCFAKALSSGGDKDIIVDNTNIKMFELAPYYRLAEVYGYEVVIVWIHCLPNLAADRNTHGVPREKVLEMAQSFEPIPPWWNVLHIYQ